MLPRRCGLVTETPVAQVDLPPSGFAYAIWASAEPPAAVLVRLELRKGARKAGAAPPDEPLGVAADLKVDDRGLDVGERRVRFEALGPRLELPARPRC